MVTYVTVQHDDCLTFKILQIIHLELLYGRYNVFTSNNDIRCILKKGILKCKVT